MTETEWALLCLGIEIGALLALIAQAIASVFDDRRDAKTSREALKRSAGDHYLASLRLYQLRQWRTRTHR